MSPLHVDEQRQHFYSEYKLSGRIVSVCFSLWCCCWNGWALLCIAQVVKAVNFYNCCVIKTYCHPGDSLSWRSFVWLVVRGSGGGAWNVPREVNYSRNGLFRLTHHVPR